jgi:hypothetical protein
MRIVDNGFALLGRHQRIHMLQDELSEHGIGLHQL